MKIKIFGQSLVLTLCSIGFAATAGAVPAFEENFTASTTPASTTVACLVALSNPTAGINACLCAASGSPSSPYCVSGGSFTVHPAFAAGWSAALGISSVSIANTIPGAGSSPFLVDARVDCGLTQGNFQLAVAPGTTSSQLSGLLGGTASYSAVYALPISTDGTNTAPLVDTSAAVAPDNQLPPVRVCSYGQVSAFVNGAYNVKPDGWHGDKGGRNKGWNANGNLSLTDLGMSVGAEWLASGTQTYANAGVQYILVAGVADGLLQVGKNRFSAIGVLANTRVGYRSLDLRTILAAIPG